MVSKVFKRPSVSVVLVASLVALTVSSVSAQVWASCELPSSVEARAQLLNTRHIAHTRSSAQLLELDSATSGPELLLISHRDPEAIARPREWVGAIHAYRCVNSTWNFAAEKSWIETTEPSDSAQDFVTAQLESAFHGTFSLLRVSVQSFNWEYDPRWSRHTQEWLRLEGDHFVSSLSVVANEETIAGPAREVQSSSSTTVTWVRSRRGPPMVRLRMSENTGRRHRSSVRMVPVL